MANTNDWIRRGDAIEAVYERIKQIGCVNNVDVLSIRQAIREVPSAQPDPRWIPCAERLPELEDDTWMDSRALMYSSPLVVTYASLPHGEPECNELAVYCEDGNWYWYTEDLDEKARVPILAWMPLPKPYQPDDFSKYMNPPEE